MFPTTLASWALVVAKALEAKGLDSHDVFRRAGLDPSRLVDPNARYPFAGMTRLWELAAQLTGDECIGIGVAEYWHPSSLHALGYAWLASESLKAALERTERYFHVVTTAGRGELTRTSGGYRFSSYPTTHQQANQAAIDAGAAVLVKLCRMCAGPQFRARRIYLAHPRPGCAERMTEYFGAPIEYDQPGFGIEIDVAEAERTLPTGNVELAHASDRIVAGYLAHLDRSVIAMRVKAKLLDTLPSGEVTEAAMAAALHVSLRTLQRKLREEGTSYKALLEDTRRELARQYMQNSRLPVTEVAYLLGFSELSNFSRAFKRWQGVSPSVYRQGLAAQPSVASN